MIYLDNAATTCIDPRVKLAMFECECYANPSSIHKEGMKARAYINQARESVADLLNCEPEQVIFTSGGSESNAMVLRGYSETHYIAENMIAISAVEHESVQENAVRFFPEAVSPIVLPVSSCGTVLFDDMIRVLEHENVKLVSVMGTNNEIPSTNCIQEIATICHENGASFHTDCVQAVGEMLLDVQQIGCDFMSLSAHKFHGPKGIGILYCKDKSTLLPGIRGSESQEFGLKGGTENLMGIIGAGKAAKIAKSEHSAIINHIDRIKHRFYSDLMRHLSAMNIQKIAHSNGFQPHLTSKILSMTFDGVDAQSLVLALSARGVCISAGSACNSNASTSSKVLKAIGLSDEQAHSTVRFSFSKYTSEEDVISAAVIVASVVQSMLVA